MNIIHVVGARPNFMKASPVLRALHEFPDIHQILVHTGQHYDANMSDVFFEQLDIPAPDANLEVGSGSHTWQTAQIMMRFEEVVVRYKPNLVLVYGDVNSTVATALVCAKLAIPVGHIEAGLRSFDRNMPEEINRRLTDQLADFLFTPSQDGNENLLREGIAQEKIYLVGNTMIDTLVRLIPEAQQRWPSLRSEVQAEAPAWSPDGFALTTLHRPSNVDDPRMLRMIVETLDEIAETIPMLFPIHPRTQQRLSSENIHPRNARLHFIAPVGYLEFLALQAHSTLVITDSGGIQEETTFLGVPCLTVRENTERPVTLTLGTNTLVGHDMERLKYEVRRILLSGSPHAQVPPLWDGRSAERIADVIAREIQLA